MSQRKNQILHKQTDVFLRNENRKYRLMVDYKALNVLMDFILGTISLPREDSEMKADSIDALCQTLNRSNHMLHLFYSLNVNQNFQTKNYLMIMILGWSSYLNFQVC